MNSNREKQIIVIDNALARLEWAAAILKKLPNLPKGKLRDSIDHSLQLTLTTPVDLSVERLLTVTKEVADSSKKVLEGVKGIRHAPMQDIEKTINQIDELLSLVYEFTHATPSH